MKTNWFLAHLICIIILSSCVGKQKSQMPIGKPSNETQLISLSMKKIMTWKGKTPKDRRFLGYLEYCSVKKSEREKKFYWIYDSAYEKIGYITDNGQFYTYEGSNLKHFGEYQINMGLKIFFGIPLEDSLDTVGIEEK